MTKLRPIDPVLINNSVGETNIPEPVEKEKITLSTKLTLTS